MPKVSSAPLHLSTLDILDKNLSDRHDSIHKMDAELRYPILQATFLLDKNYWETYYPKLKSTPFDWREFKYSDIKDIKDINRIIKSTDTGIYMFIIKPVNLIYDLPKFIFYIGIAGEGKSKRALRDRLKDYYHFDKIKKRKKVHRFLGNYYKNVYVVYSLMKKTKKNNLETIEENLHGFYCPIGNERDFPYEIKQVKKAF